MRVHGKIVDGVEFYKEITRHVYEYARKHSSDEEIVDFISEVIGKIPYSDKDTMAQLLLHAVQTKIGGPNNYLPDAIRNERISSPVSLIRRYKEGKRTAGDCDDFVAVLHTLYHAVGIPSVAVFVHYYKQGGNPQVPNHIALAVRLSDDKWYIADPTSKLPILPKHIYEKKVGPILYVYPLKIDNTIYSPEMDGWGTRMIVKNGKIASRVS